MKGILIGDVYFIVMIHERKEKTDPAIPVCQAMDPPQNQVEIGTE